MAFAAGKIASGLVYGQIVFRPGEVHGANAPIRFVVFYLQRNLAGRQTIMSGVNQTTALGISLGMHAAVWKMVGGHNTDFRIHTPVNMIDHV